MIYHEIRFHLLNGENHMHWQIKTFNNKKITNIAYYNPEDVQLVMHNCSLFSNTKKAIKVNAKQKRNVCGGVHCEDYTVQAPSTIDTTYRLRYSPIHDPYWRLVGDTRIWDTKQFHELVTQNNKIYVTPNNEPVFDYDWQLSLSLI